MFSIRAEQLEIFERIQFERMLHRVESAIATVFPETCAAPLAEGEHPERRKANEPCKGVVGHGIESGVRLGIQDAPDLAAYIALGLAMRETPPKSGAWITNRLRRPDMEGATRLSVIETMLKDLGAGDPALHAISERMAAARRECA